MSDDEFKLTNIPEQSQLNLNTTNSGGQVLSDSLEKLELTTSLLELDGVLTQMMAKQQIQPLIRGENLDKVVEMILSRAVNEDKGLLGTAMLARLAAVARAREERVLKHVEELISDEPPSLESLSDIMVDSNQSDTDIAKVKLYAAQGLRHLKANWLVDYCLREGVKIDTAEIARKELFLLALEKTGTVTQWLSFIQENVEDIKRIDNKESQLRRIRRIAQVILDVLKTWEGDTGESVGAAIDECFRALLNKSLVNVDQESLFVTLDSILGCLVRLIELRFSHALYGQTYLVMQKNKQLLGAGLWGKFLSSSAVISRLRVDLLEAAMVLARQNRTDKEIISTLLTCYTSKAQLSAAIKRHLSHAQDLDPDITAWWINASPNLGERREVEHKVGNTEDEQIGMLLIEVEYAKETMEKLNRAVAPMLEISDPVLAETVKSAAARYQEMAQITRRLARMRKLSKSGLMFDHVEYNSREHEMKGGHQAGIRRVRVIRDGIIKEFNGKMKTLVKPLVEAEE
ncbi:hypothetical protein [Methylophaga thiooxydans]|uniref:hypothetical protein n=1 Tax=Methylophaga thiooxydans TaxID=392484 RepID=UPI0023533E03|nr:hypothetical protein [Methylophaga thiooxydans]